MYQRAPSPLNEKIVTCPMEGCGVQIVESLMVWVANRNMCITCGEKLLAEWNRDVKGGECGRD